MRITVTLDDDVAAAVERLQRERAIGRSQAVNDLIRAGLVGHAERQPFRQETYPMGSLIDVTHVAEALDILEGPDHR